MKVSEINNFLKSQKEKQKFFLFAKIGRQKLSSLVATR